MSGTNHDIVSLVKNMPEYRMFGAQIAYGAYRAIEHFSRKKPEAFIVSNLRNNPSAIDDIPVTSDLSFNKNSLIIVAVTEIIQKEVIPYLNKNGFHNLFILSDHDEFLLMSAYYNDLNIFPCATSRGDGKVDVVLYEAHSHKDKFLISSPKHKEFEKSVHAGSALGGELEADFDDNTGNNISSKNKQYCEMSVTYWVWKNQYHDWMGIEHYRRHLLVKPEMLTNDVDVILPLPYMFAPNALAHFRAVLSENVIDALFVSLRILHPEEFDDYIKIINDYYQYTYNMLCAKKSVFDAYCKWFFEITDYMETMSDKVSEIKETRALSYVAEILTNIYFMYNKDKLNIRHAEKIIFT
ncbi:MAG: DUF4422 domain-containing protein [Ruminiclostridium sp.]|nr:DUF4422 domain-containing protein [Ruminiclostridium sp.]